MHRCASLVLPLLLCGCFKIEARSTAPTSSNVTEQLMGEWIGTWGSADVGTQSTGVLTLSVQSFLGLPVLRLQSDNPCLLPQDYTLTMVDRHLELHGSDDAVFAADIAADLRSLEGTYSCTMGNGTWSASWVRDLGPVGDVTGHWLGAFAATSPIQATGVLSLDLQQQWVHGVLRVTGQLSSPSLPQPMAISNGDVVFDEGTFQLELTTDPTSAPFVMLSALGDSHSMLVHDGQVVIGIPPGTLLGSGTWRALWTGP
jgi:hypothetical protein